VLFSITTPTPPAPALAVVLHQRLPPESAKAIVDIKRVGQHRLAKPISDDRQMVAACIDHRDPHEAGS
jgi:hypothetical protein